jgi:DNA polymerase V
MLLAKVSMDIEAKHNKDCIAKWNYDDVKTKLWNISPLSKMWGIGPRMEKRLNDLNIYSIKDLALYDKNKLKDKFGIMGLELWNHANGIDESNISDYKNIKKDKSISHSQVLFKDYYEENAKLIITEMVEVTARRLREKNLESACIGLGIGYSKDINDGFFHTTKLEVPTNNESEILKTCLLLFDRFYDNLPIRKITISCSRLCKSLGMQLNLFESYEEKIESFKYQKTIDEVKNKYGKNSLLKASSLLDSSTIKERNEKIGGHHE